MTILWFHLCESIFGFCFHFIFLYFDFNFCFILPYVSFTSWIIRQNHSIECFNKWLFSWSNPNTIEMNAIKSYKERKKKTEKFFSFFAFEQGNERFSRDVYVCAVVVVVVAIALEIIWNAFQKIAFNICNLIWCFISKYTSFFTFLFFFRFVVVALPFILRPISNWNIYSSIHQIIISQLLKAYKWCEFKLLILFYIYTNQCCSIACVSVGQSFLQWEKESLWLKRK